MSSASIDETKDNKRQCGISVNTFAEPLMGYTVTNPCDALRMTNGAQTRGYNTKLSS